MDINELTYQINGAVFEVNKVLGPGFLDPQITQITPIRKM